MCSDLHQVKRQHTWRGAPSVVTSLSLYQQLAASISWWRISDSILHNKMKNHIKQTRNTVRGSDKPATGDKRQEVFPVSEGGNHQERPGWYNPSSNIAQAHLCSLQPATSHIKRKIVSSALGPPTCNQYSTHITWDLTIRLVYGSISEKCHMLTATVSPVQVLVAGPHLCTSPSPPLPIDSTHADSFPPATGLNIG